jgi:uncharacterized membrane protein YfcA
LHLAGTAKTRAVLVGVVFGGFETTQLAVIFGIVLFGGLVKGTAGFGYAIASTAILATYIDPTQAVVVMILPMLVGNLSLVRELDRDGFRSCVRRFWPYVAAAVVGTLAGMAVLDRVPTGPMAVALGLFVLGYVLVKQDRVALPGERWVRERCFTTGLVSKVGLGLVSGVVFGTSNVAVQVVAYLDGLSLDRSTFVGVLSMVLVGISVVRLGAAYALGLFGTEGLLAVSAVAAVPGLLGVVAGGRLRARLDEAALTVGVLALLAVIALRLLAKGLFGV